MLVHTASVIVTTVKTAATAAFASTLTYAFLVTLAVLTTLVFPRPAGKMGRYAVRAAFVVASLCAIMISVGQGGPAAAIGAFIGAALFLAIA